MDENFLLYVTLSQHHDAIFDFWDPLIRQEVITVESSNFGHSSFKTLKFYPLVGAFAPPRNVKTMGNGGLHSY